MIDNLSFGLDIATALSVIAAAILFIWNSANSSKKEKIQREKETVHERIERRKVIIQKQVFQIADKLADDVSKVNTEINTIYSGVSGGDTSQNLNSYRDVVLELTIIFRVRLVPLGKTYGDGRFIKLATDYDNELRAFLQRLKELTSGDSDESWDFNDVMYTPLTITENYIGKLISKAEDFIDSL